MICNEKMNLSDLFDEKMNQCFNLLHKSNSSQYPIQYAPRTLHKYRVVSRCWVALASDMAHR